ncbi:MAG TPA: NTP transferase domain-containing protein [Candidatus Dormibacteraeota bacterium]|nr:NTP transferase domain-containing protein [Candidatus Dormibacteraeota bacterium]
MRAVITAGGQLRGAYAEAAGTTVKALARVRGRTMLERTIEAAHGAGALETAVVGDEPVRAACAGGLVERVIPASEDGAENVLRALRAWPHDDALLYLTSDLPYVRAAAITDFVERAEGRLAIALTDAAAFALRFPGAPGFGIAIGRERVVNGGAFFLPPGGASRVAELAAKFFNARKHPWRMARLAGPDLLCRLLFNAISIPMLERRSERLLGLRVQAVRNCAPELGFDADELAQYRYACAHE